MRYIPKVTPESVRENHRHFMERVSIFKKRGFDFSRTLRFVLKKAEPLRGSILEIGTGKGHTMLALAKAGHKFYINRQGQKYLKDSGIKSCLTRSCFP